MGHDFLQLQDEFVAYLSESHCPPETVAAYRRDLGLFQEYLSQPGQQLSGSSLAGYRGWLVKRHASALSTLRRRLSAVRSFLRFVHEQSITVSDVSEAVELPPVGRTPPARPEGEDVVALLAGPDPDSFIGARDALMMQLASFVGLGPREICALRISDFDASTGMLQIQGRRRGSQVAVSDRLRENITKYVHDHDLSSGGVLTASLGPLAQVTQHTARR